MLIKPEPLLRTGQIFARLLYKINFSLKNKSEFLLGLDLLRDSVKRDLLFTTCLALEKEIITLVNSDLRFYKKKDFKELFLNLVSQISEKFLVKYYGRSIKISSKMLNRCLYNTVIIEDIQILLQTPLQSLVDPECKIFRTTFSPVYNNATDSFLEALFENLIIQISNCVIFIIVNEFSDIYDLRQNLYKSNFLSVRNLERFKNNFLWQTTIKATIKRPNNIYNSRYGLWIVRTTGVYYKMIYANRSEELIQLRKLPLVTVTLIEFLDFTSSRFDELFYTLGNGLRYTLTSVIGQVIGLIWRGVIEGLKK
jgi:hypothetical protein